MPTIIKEIPKDMDYDMAVEIYAEIYEEKAIRLLSSVGFKNYVKDKCLEAIKKIASEQLSTINTQEDIDNSLYMSSMEAHVENDYIIISNNSEIDISQKIANGQLKATALESYPTALSLAKIVEYGIGYTGLTNTPQLGQDIGDWEYDVNSHGYKGWYYTNDSGQTFWTNGFEGRLVFLRLLHWVNDNIGYLVNDYLLKNIKD